MLTLPPVIFGNVELARLGGGDPARPQRLLDQAMVGAHRARELVRQILAFGPRTARQKEPVHVSAIRKALARNSTGSGGGPVTGSSG
jgi:hypothetical protein